MAVSKELEEYSALRDERDELEARLTRISARLGELEEPVLDWFAQAGLSSVNMYSGRSISIAEESYAHREAGVGFEEIAQALDEAGLGALLERKCNMNTLSAWCRERLRNGEGIPESFAGKITVNKTFKINTRRPPAGRRTSD